MVGDISHVPSSCRHWWKWSPIGAWEWLDPKSSYLTGSGCWWKVNFPCRGDVAAYNGHVGIVTSYGKTISAAHSKVVRTEWGFRPGKESIFWRYEC